MVQAHDFRWKKLVGKMVLSEAPGVQRTSRTNKYSTTSSPVMSGFEALACHACSSGRRCHKSKEFTTLATKETIAIETAFHTVIDIIVFFSLLYVLIFVVRLYGVLISMAEILLRIRRVVASAAANGLLSGCSAAFCRYQPPKSQDFLQNVLQNGEHAKSQQPQSICLYNLFI